jgi:nitroreductase
MDERLARYLSTRRSIPAAQLRDPAPDPAMLQEMLTAAARVPDHGKIAPWRFILFDRPARERAIAGLVEIAGRNPDEKEGRYRADKARGFADAPLVVGVISAPVADHPKVPVWEQELSSACVALELLHAAFAYGFAAQWLTGWYAYDDEARAWLGVKPGEQVAGFLHIGTPAVPPVERDRPEVAKLVTRWEAARG